MKGIDYGLGQTNIDMQTRIRFGVIPAHNVPYWYEESEAVYLYACPECEFESIEHTDICEKCEYEFGEDEFDELEPFYFEYTGDGYACTQSYDDPDIFIEKIRILHLCGPMLTMRTRRMLPTQPTGRNGP